MAKTTKDENALEHDKREIFALEYCVSLNGTQAAIRAGYAQNSAHVEASRLLRDAKVLTRVCELMKERAESLKIDAGFVLKSLLEVYGRCMENTPVMVWDGEQKAMVHEINENGIGVYKFDSAGALKALEMIGKHLKMFTDKSEITGADGNELTIRIVRPNEAQ
jgi:phage terminase small subunit